MSCCQSPINLSVIWQVCTCCTYLLLSMLAHSPCVVPCAVPCAQVTGWHGYTLLVSWPLYNLLPRIIFKHAVRQRVIRGSWWHFDHLILKVEQPAWYAWGTSVSVFHWVCSTSRLQLICLKPMVHSEFAARRLLDCTIFTQLMLIAWVWIPAWHNGGTGGSAIKTDRNTAQSRVQPNSLIDWCIVYDLDTKHGYKILQAIKSTSLVLTGYSKTVVAQN